MKISVLTVVDRGAKSGARSCEGCREPGHVLREVRIPYSGEGSYWRDLCPRCIDDLRRMPNLPEQHGAQDKVKADAAFDKSIRRLRSTPGKVGGLRAYENASAAESESEALDAPGTR